MPTPLISFSRLAGLVLAGSLLAGCQKAKPATAEAVAPATATDNVAVTLTPVRRQLLAQPIAASGQLSSETEARLSFKTGGLVRRVLVKEGDYVQRGQLLAALDLTEISAQVTQAEQGQTKARRDLDRFGRLLADSAAPREAVENLRTAYAVAQEQVRIARFNRQFSEIRAPVAGRIVRKLLNEGELAAPGTPVLFMNATTGADTWTLKAGVADKDWARLRVGDPATVRLDAYPDRDFTGRVSRLAAGADPASGTWQIDIQVRPQAGAALATGLFARASLRPRQQAAYHVVPAEALIEGEGENAFVFAPAATGSRVRKLPIRVAFLDGGRVYVRAGLDSVAQVVAQGAGFLTEYSTINVRPPAGPTAPLTTRN
ncbi:efflux RND transporter periplasmic adaptor subunit [Hymenobacter sp.]|uniref:efflux RND transporter periplasmic adaptor subunit n=1 Tax=Hymenobacter sp. TaxID=1898978 RepID=UPI00286B6B9E|nr:efflux RND transporter periplasmic adaptor subunit [Hymenobacter sp.]